MRGTDRVRIKEPGVCPPHTCREDGQMLGAGAPLMLRGFGDINLIMARHGARATARETDTQSERQRGRFGREELILVC